MGWCGLVALSCPSSGNNVSQSPHFAFSSLAGCFRFTLARLTQARPEVQEAGAWQGGAWRRGTLAHYDMRSALCKGLWCGLLGCAPQSRSLLCSCLE